MNRRILLQLVDYCRTVEPVASSRHAAAVVYKNKIIAVGCNSTKTHPIQAKYGRNSKSIHLHAEVHAMIKATALIGEKKLKVCELYVIRLGRTGELMNSKPCHGCQRMIDDLGFTRVYHS